MTTGRRARSGRQGRRLTALRGATCSRRRISVLARSGLLSPGGWSISAARSSGRFWRYSPCASASVPVDAIVDALWPHDPPATAGKIIQTYVSRLRRELGEGTIARRGSAYSLRAAVDAQVSKSWRPAAFWPMHSPSGGDRAGGPCRLSRPEDGGGTAGGVAPASSRGADRRRHLRRPAPRCGGGVALDRGGPSASGAAPIPAHARPLPIGTAGGGAGRVSGGATFARRRARHRARGAAAGTRGRDPPSEPALETAERDGRDAGRNSRLALRGGAARRRARVS